MNKEMKKRLNSLVGKDILVSIYDDTDEPDTFTLGYLLQMDDNDILINIIDQFGQENGLCTLNLDDIFIFDEDKMYIEKMQKLFTIKNQKRRYIANLGANPMFTLLKYAVDNHLLIEVNNDDNYMGFVSGFSEDILVLNVIDNYCNDLGDATIDMNHINILTCQDNYLKDLQLLYDRNIRIPNRH